MEKKIKPSRGIWKTGERGNHSSSVVREGLHEKGHLNMSLNQEGETHGAQWGIACGKGEQQVQRP